MSTTAAKTTRSIRSSTRTSTSCTPRRRRWRSITLPTLCCSWSARACSLISMRQTRSCSTQPSAPRSSQPTSRATSPTSRFSTACSTAPRPRALHSTTPTRRSETRSSALSSSPATSTRPSSAGPSTSPARARSTKSSSARATARNRSALSRSK
eukprot:Amastigsp_a5947_14.p3 type:complete len:154 gc:universal Amastigsp_a5947_14:695-234(-)